jgi:hypothetical protein
MFDKNLLTALFIGAGMSLSAQWNVNHATASDFPSYMVTTEMDTLQGDIKYGKRMFGGLLNKIRFQSPGEGWKSYKATDIVGFSINGQNYRAMKVEGYMYFMREVFIGNTALHYREHNYVDRSNLGEEISQLHGSYGRMIQVYVTHSGKTERIYRASFRDQMGKIFKYEGEVLSAIDENHWVLQDIEQVFSLVNDRKTGYTEVLKIK